MESRRQQQIGKEIQKELGNIFQKSGPNFFGRAFVTITNVNITPDLLIARIYLSIYNVKDKEAVLDQIRSHVNEIRHQLGNKMRHQLRRIPELEFFQDETLDYVYRMEEIFNDIEKDEDDTTE